MAWLIIIIGHLCSECYAELCNHLQYHKRLPLVQSNCYIPTCSAHIYPTNEVNETRRRWKMSLKVVLGEQCFDPATWCESYLICSLFCTKDSFYDFHWIIRATLWSNQTLLMHSVWAVARVFKEKKRLLKSDVRGAVSFVKSDCAFIFQRIFIYRRWMFGNMLTMQKHIYIGRC